MAGVAPATSEYEGAVVFATGETRSLPPQPVHSVDEWTGGARKSMDADEAAAACVGGSSEVVCGAQLLRGDDFNFAISGFVDLIL